MDVDLPGEDHLMHHDPEMQEKRFLRQRVTYQAVPGKYENPPANRKAQAVSPKGISKRPTTQSSPLLPPAERGGEKRPPKLRPVSKGPDMLRMLADGALPSRIFRPM
ncbi:unnamed protein product [Effrenium voratum]|nr:unnamed protein product [Effrenium voratum]